MGVINFSILVIIAGLIILVVPVLIGVYVYRDAKSRNMDAALWTLVAILVPSFIGLIIYLVIRNNSAGQNCPSCKNPVNDGPYCGMHLKASCPSCAAPVNSGWKLCPKCGAELPAQQVSQYGAPDHPKKDRKLTWIILAAVILPVLILILVFAAMLPYQAATRMTSISQGYNIIAEEEHLPQEVTVWMEECDDTGKGVYVLKLPYNAAPGNIPVAAAHSGSGETINTFYIYMNEYKDSGVYKYFSGNAEVKNKALTVNFHASETTQEKGIVEYQLTNIITTGQEIKEVKILINGSEVEYKATGDFERAK